MGHLSQVAAADDMEHCQSVPIDICRLMTKIKDCFSFKPVSFEVVSYIAVDNRFTHFSMLLKKSVGLDHPYTLFYF